jgi:hypothetical protein
MIWLGSGVVALMALLTIGRRPVQAPGSTTPSRAREEFPPDDALENERKAA